MLMLGNLFVFMSFQMLLPTLPPYIKSIGASGLEIGLVTALFSIGAVLSRPFIGHMLEYQNRRPLVISGAVFLLVVTMVYPISQIVIIFLLFRFIHGLAWGWSTTVNGTAAVDVVPSSRLGEGMGYYGLSITIAMIIAPSVGIYLYQVTTFTTVIIISSILGLIALGLLSIVRYRTPELVQKTNREDLTFSYFRSFIEKSSWYPSLITLAATLAYGTIVTFIVIFGEERGIEHIFLFYLVNAVMASISRPIAGKWFDRNGPKGLVIFCLSLSFAGMWALSLSYSAIGVMIAGVLFGIGYGSLTPTLQSWTISITPANRIGVANGMFFSSIDLGIGLSGLLFGALAAYVEISALFQISSFFLIMGIILTLLENRKQKASYRNEVKTVES
ncbi:MFS transporter [Bacillus spongiae]|uniref:MFS transporter n=1 Tax=Bacillus spongiae TaxID=2683610 RepID=A0ABU8HEB1_9BACI